MMTIPRIEKKTNMQSTTTPNRTELMNSSPWLIIGDDLSRETSVGFKVSSAADIFYFFSSGFRGPNPLIPYIKIIAERALFVTCGVINPACAPNQFCYLYEFGKTIPKRYS
jgi:hypothetical protein